MNGSTSIRTSVSSQRNVSSTSHTTGQRINAQTSAALNNNNNYSLSKWSSEETSQRLATWLVETMHIPLTDQ